MSMALACLLALGFGMMVAPYLRRESVVARFLLIAISFVMIVRYTIWRVDALPRIEFRAFEVLVYAFFAIEMVATFLAMEDLKTLKITVDRTPEVERQLDWYGERPPRVDILIATYNEPWEVLEKTVVGATSQHYSNYAVWILDDGNREWLREKAAACGIGYVTRNNNAHYKAGNLNNGVTELRARGIELEFLALLDADFIARPEFLRRTMALMKADDVGIVQTPQCFYNPDPHQQAFGGVQNWPDEQRAWFDSYLPALDAQGAATCCGTSCLIRMSALDVIGGFPTASVCEDTLSSLKMQKHGLRTLFLQERLTVGLAPEGIGEFMTQRARWILGGVQNTRHMGSNPGLRGRVRYWLTLWQLAIWGIMPLLWVALCIGFWFTKVTLIDVIDLDEALNYFAPLWLLRLFQGWLFGGRQHFFVSDAIWMLLGPLWVTDTFRAIVGAKSRFKVTDKALHRDRVKVHWRLLRFYGVLVVLLVTGMLYTFLDPTAPAHHDGFWQPNTVLSIWFILVILAGVAPMVEPPKRRNGERYRSSELVTALADGRQMTWRCRDISLGGLLVQTDGRETVPSTVELVLSGHLPVRAELVRSPSRAVAAFAFRDPKARPDLIRRLYCTDDYIQMPARWGLPRALGSFFKRLLY